MSPSSSDKRVAIIGDDASFVGALKDMLRERGLSARRLTASALRNAARSPDLTVFVGNAALDGGARMLEEIGSTRGPFAIVAPQGALAARIEARRRGVAVLAKKEALAEIADDVERLLNGEGELPFGTPVERVISDVKTEVGQRLGGEASHLRIRPGEESAAKELVEEFVQKLAAISEPGLTPSQPPPAPMDGLDWDDDPQTLKRTHSPPSKRTTLPGISRFPSAAALLAQGAEPDSQAVTRTAIGIEPDSQAVTRPALSIEELEDDLEASFEDVTDPVSLPAAKVSLSDEADVTAPHTALDDARLEAISKPAYDSSPPIYPAVPKPPKPPPRPPREPAAEPLLLQPKETPDAPQAELEPAPQPPGPQPPPSIPPEAPAPKPQLAPRSVPPPPAPQARSGGGGLVLAFAGVVLLLIAVSAGVGAYLHFQPPMTVSSLHEDPQIADGPADPDVAPPTETDVAPPTENDVPAPREEANAEDGAEPTGGEGTEEPTDEGNTEEPVGDTETPADEGSIEAPPVVGDPREAADALVDQGEEHERFRRYAEARQAFEQAVAILETHPHAHAGLARALIALGDGAAAVPHAERAASLRRRRADYQVLVGDARAAAGDSGGARRAYLRALDVDPRNADAPQRLSGL